MDRKRAVEEIKARWRDLYPADGHGRGKGIVCPICGNGSGEDGDGIVENKKSKNRNSLICFKCKEWKNGFSGGSVIDLYMIEHGMDKDNDFYAAVDELAARLGIVIDDDPHVSGAGRAARPGGGAGTSSYRQRPVSTGARIQRGNEQDAPGKQEKHQAQEAQQPQQELQEYNYNGYYLQCMENLQRSEAAQAYLSSRGISLDTALSCMVGFDPNWKSPTVLRNQRARGSAWEPDGKPCIIIPSNAAHYVARDIRPKDQLDSQQRKFQKMNEGTPGIFNGHQAFNSDAENIFVTEGAFDALSLLEIGQPAIALNSTANVDKLLKQMQDEPTKATLILCLDNDEAGKGAALKLKDGLRRLNISCISANISGVHKDPNEALAADRAGFERAVIQAAAQTAARPDNTEIYLDNLMAGEIERFREARNRKTGFQNIDEKAGGLYPGLYALAAISSLGKTTLALQMADQIAASGRDVLFFSMEQSRLEMVSKSLARITAQQNMKTAVTSLSIRRGNLPSQVLEAAELYKKTMGERISIIECNFNADIGYIADYIRLYRKRTETDPIIFIDYLQIIQPAAEGKQCKSKKDEVDLAVTELKRLSRELNLTIIVISSLNRANYLTPFAFESLKESGNIEYTSDVVWGMQLACLDEPLFDSEGKIKMKRKRIDEAKVEMPRKIKFVCLKNRYGISNYECYMSYYPQYDLFVPAEAPGAETAEKARKYCRKY